MELLDLLIRCNIHGLAAWRLFSPFAVVRGVAGG